MRGWIHFESKCLKIFGEEVEYREAKTICESKGAKINSIDSREENEFIVNLIRKNDPSVHTFWIGARKGKSQTDVFECENGNPFSFTK
jgi:hypothetical protein